MLHLTKHDGSGPIDPLELVLADRRQRSDRPWVMLNFVISIDGATAVDGQSTKLGDEDDLAMFQALRTVPDVILVGAKTVIVEDYRPVSLDPERRKVRAQRGQSPAPKLAIVSGTMSLDVESRVFSDSEYKPLIITGVFANPGRLALIGDAADVAILEELNPQTILGRLSDAGVVLIEGGPSLAGQFIAAGLVDELNVTIAPVLVGGGSDRLLGPMHVDPPAEMKLDRALQGDRMLILRYLKN
jgi:5-amino-6-(5-phosphoribosylamino)uracil reductase